jgi:sugar phosphate permease
LLKKVLSNKNVWFIALVLLCYLITQQGTFSFLPTYLSQVRGVTPVEASAITSVASIVGIPVGILTGLVADKAGSRKKTLGILMLACGVSYLLLPLFPTGLYIIMIIFYGVATMGIVGLVMSLATEVVDSPEEGSMSIAVVNLAQWVGIFLSSLVFGWLTENTGWDSAFYIMIPIAVAGAIFAFINRRLK